MSNKPIDKEYLTTQFVNFKNSLPTGEIVPKEGDIISTNISDKSKLPKLDENHKWIKVSETKIDKKDINRAEYGYIPTGTYSQKNFWNLLKQYVPRGSIRACKGSFAVKVKDQVISQTDGYIISSDIYTRPTVVLFKNELDSYNYSSYSIDPENFGETRAYVADYDERQPIKNSFDDIGGGYNESISIYGDGIEFC